MLQIQDIYITDGFGNRKKLGTRNGNTFFSYRKRSKHFFRKYNGWGIDIDIIHHEAIERFVIFDSENNMRYEATKEHFLQFGKQWNTPGHGEQLILPIQHWVEKPLEVI